MRKFYGDLSKLLNFLQGLIFVVDSNDRERIQEAAEELQKMVNINIFGTELTSSVFTLPSQLFCKW